MHLGLRKAGLRCLRNTSSGNLIGKSVGDFEGLGWWQISA